MVLVPGFMELAGVHSDNEDLMISNRRASDRMTGCGVRGAAAYK